MDEMMMQQMAMQDMMGPPAPPGGMGGGGVPEGAGVPPMGPEEGGLVTIEVPAFALPMIAELLSSLIDGGPGAPGAPSAGMPVM